MRGVPRARRAISRAPRRASTSHAEDAGRPDDDGLEVGGVVVVEAGDEPEAVAQRAGDEPGAGGGADQREPGQVEADATGPPGPCRARCRAGSPPSPGRGPPRRPGTRRWISSMKRTSPSSRLVRMAARSPARSRAGPEVMCRPHAHLVGDDAGQRGLAQAGRAGEEQVVGGLAPPAGRLEEDRRGAP